MRDDGAGGASPGSPYELQALDMGVYRWGSLLPVFTRLGPASAQDFPRNIAGMIAGVGTWNTPAEFRGWAALTHELTHYLQDVTTGVGHWDHFVRRRTLSPLFSQALLLCGPETRFPAHVGGWSRALQGSVELGAAAKIRELQDELRDELLFLDASVMPPARSTALEQRVTPLLAAGARHDVYGIQFLLEGEAAAVVIKQVLGLDEATKEQWEIVRENLTVWNPDRMPGEYGELWFEIVAILQHLYGEDVNSLPTRQRDAFYELTGTLMGLLVDIACAHPAAELLAEWGVDRGEYEPGVRYLRMLAAIGAMDGPSLGQLVTAIVEGDLERAEAGMLARCSFSYAPVREIYEDWKPRLEASAKSEDSWIDRIRADCCRIRLEQPGAWIEKSLFAILQHSLPFLVSGPAGIASIGQRWEHLEPTATAEIYGDVTRNSMVLAISDFFFETGRYVCPLAQAQTCEAARAECLSGIRQPSEFPPAAGCRVREWLQELGFYMGGTR
jgi:hypothetical protein